MERPRGVQQLDLPKCITLGVRTYTPYVHALCDTDLRFHIANDALKRILKLGCDAMSWSDRFID
jgi:hypothetical protein